MKTWIFKCLACGDEWRYYRQPKKCSACGEIDEFLKIETTVVDMPSGRQAHMPSAKRVKKVKKK